MTSDAAQGDMRRLSGGGSDPGTPTSRIGPAELDDRAWMAEALCAGCDPDLWFPEKGHAYMHAVRVCLQCPVRVPCLEYALANNEMRGIWGATTVRERRRIVAERTAQRLEGVA